MANGKKINQSMEYFDVGATYGLIKKVNSG